MPYAVDVVNAAEDVDVVVEVCAAAGEAKAGYTSNSAVRATAVAASVAALKFLVIIFNVFDRFQVIYRNSEIVP
jgi:hypothetical protein